MLLHMVFGTVKENCALVGGFILTNNYRTQRTT